MVRCAVNVPDDWCPASVQVPSSVVPEPTDGARSTSYLPMRSTEELLPKFDKAVAPQSTEELGRTRELQEKLKDTERQLL
eukprot:COSAG02_NODE_46694_length_347_cov_0.463710_1_plen_79_part_10